MPAKLTIKQEKYVQNLFAGMSQREAYKNSYDANNMTDKTIDEKACILANDDKIKARLDELTNELKDRNMVTVEKVLSQLSKIAFCDIKDMLSYKTVQTLDETATALIGKPIMTYKTVIDLKDSNEVDGTLIAEVQETRDGFKFKRNDQMKALELLGKHLGMFKEDVSMKVTGQMQNYNYDISQLTPEQLAAMEHMSYSEVEEYYKQCISNNGK